MYSFCANVIQGYLYCIWLFDIYISNDTVFFNDPPVFLRDFLGSVFPCRSFRELILIMESPSREILDSCSGVWGLDG